MTGRVREARLDSPTSRGRLRRGAKHWRVLETGRAALGYQRWPGKRGEAGGVWFLRRYVGRKYRIETIARADDMRLADGEAVLDFNQAQAAARARLNSPGRPTTDLTVRQAMANYIVLKRANGQPISDLQSRVTAHILPTLGDLVVAELTAEQLRSWLAGLAAAPAMVRTKRGKAQRFELTPDSDDAKRARQASANRVLTMLKAGLNHAFDEGHVATNKAWGRRVKPFRDVEVARIRYLTVAEARRLINACDPEFRPVVRAALETGCRYGELTRLEVQDFNPDAGTVAIRRSKSGKPRHVVVTTAGAEFFREITAGRQGSEVIFRRPDGRPWGSSQQGRPMREACERAGIDPPVGIHQLRHTWASLSVMGGVPLMVIAKNLGHVDTRMVEKHYGHMAPSYIADAIRAGAPSYGLESDRKVVALK